MNQLIHEFPNESEKAFGRVARKVRKDFANSPLIPNSPKRKTKKLKDSLKVKVSGYRVEVLQADYTFNNPHFHLVERGHRLVTNKRHGHKEIGFVQGKHFVEEFAQENSDEIHKDLAMALYRAIKRRLR